jgi:glycosyltransferase involved in cell wall biosynthesis
MHILIVALSAAQGPSGICRHAYNLARCASKRKEVQRVTLVVGQWQKQYFLDLFAMNDAKITVFCSHISNKPFHRNLWYLYELPCVAKTLSVDIVHLSFPVPIRRKAFICPIVVSLHDFYPYDKPDNFGFPKVLFNRFFLKKCIAEADSLACISETTFSRLKFFAPQASFEKGVVVYNCVDISAIAPISPAVINNLNGSLFLLVAQHRPNKNIILTLVTFKMLLLSNEIKNESILLLIGNKGPETAKINKFISCYGIEKNVFLLDRITESELIWLYKKCDLLIAASSIEGFGLPVAEALLCDCCVVCSDIHAFREIGGKECHYFELHSRSPASEMATAILKALSEQRHTIENSERFSLETISAQYAALYMQLLKSVVGLKCN